MLHKVWKLFNQFFVRLDVKPANWEDRMVLFTGFLIDCRLQSSSVKSYLSAIRAVLMENNIKLNEDQFLLSSLMRACKLNNDRLVMRLPIHKELLHTIIKHVHELFCCQPYLLRLYSALMLTSYYGLLRVGEITKGPHVLLAKNVHITLNKNKILLILFSSKTHGTGDKPQQIKITGKPAKTGVSSMVTSAMEKYNPFKALQQYLTCKTSCQKSG